MFRSHPNGQEMVRRLVHRVVPYLTVEQLDTWLLDLIILFPLASRDHDSWGRWPEITGYIRTPNESRIKPLDTDDSRKKISKLIDSLSSDDIQTRTDAALRLLFAFENKLLSDNDRSSFEQALWNRIDAQGLPVIDNANIRKVVHLEWPSDQVHLHLHAIEGIAAWITSETVKDRFTLLEKEGEDGKPQYSVSWPDSENYLHHLLHLAHHLRNQPAAFSELFSEECRRHILNSILQWWQRERDRFRNNAKSSELLGGDVYDRIDLALQVIFECALGTDVPDETSADEVRAFLNDIAALRPQIPYACPIHAYLDRELQSTYWDELRLGLRSGNGSVDYKALVAIWQWQRSVERFDLMPMTPVVFQSLVTIIGNVRGTLCSKTYDVMADLITGGYLITKNFDLTYLTDALESAAHGLRYGQDANETIGKTGFDKEMCPHYRRSLARFLFLIRDRDIPIGPIATEWIDKAKSDRFVDVRRAANGV